MTDDDPSIPSDLAEASPTAKICYLVLDGHDDAVSQKQLATETHCGVRSVRRALLELINKDHVNQVVDPSRNLQYSYYALRESDTDD